MGSIFSNESLEEIPSETTQLNHLENLTTIIEQNGDKYFGEIKDNKRHGYGICIYLNHENYNRYEGFWKNNQKYSKGTMLYKDGSTYIGQWKNDLREGEGTIYYSSGEKFCGHFFEDKKNGKGTFYSKNYNSIFMGSYKNDVKNGKGITYFKKTNKIIKEIWEDGIIISCKMEKNKNFMNDDEDTLNKSLNKIYLNSPPNIGKEKNNLNNIKNSLSVIKYYKASIPNNFFDIMNLVIMTYDLLYDNGEIVEWKENNIIKLFERIGIEKNKYNDIILNNQINGTVFLKLTFNDLKEYKINDVKDVKIIMKSVYFLREFFTKYFEYYMEYEREEEAKSKVPMNQKQTMKQFTKSSSKILLNALDKNILQKSTPDLFDKLNKKIYEEDKNTIYRHVKGKSEQIDELDININNNQIDINEKSDEMNNDEISSFLRKKNKSITIKTDSKNRKKEIIENVGFTLTKMSITKLFMHSLFQNGFDFFIPYNEIIKGEEMQHEENAYQLFLGKWQGKKIIMKCVSVNKLQKDIKVNKKKYNLTIRDIMQNFIKEINICNNLRHPNIVLFIGISINKTDFYQIFEYIENKTLYDLLHKEKPIKSILKINENNNFKLYGNNKINNNIEKSDKKSPIKKEEDNNIENSMNISINNIDINDDNESEKIQYENINTYDNFHHLEEISQGKILFQIAYEISIALRYIHSRNIIHCNLKSKYIFLDEEYHVKLANFSLSKIVNFFSDNNKEEQFFIENKEEWTPPEILTNGKFEESSDVYSFGIILYELFTGEIPHKSIGDNQIAGLAKIISENNLIYRYLISLIKKCISEEPKNRPSLENISNFLYKASKLFDKREFTFEELGNFILA